MAATYVDVEVTESLQVLLEHLGRQLEAALDRLTEEVRRIADNMEDQD